MGKGKHTNSDFTQAPAWVTSLLLVVGIIAPVVCVIWLVNKAVENEKTAVERLLAEADARTLEDAEDLLFDVLENGDTRLRDLAYRFELGVVTDTPNRAEIDGARKALKDLRNEMAKLDAIEAQLRVARFLESEHAWLRLPGGHAAGGIALELGLEHAEKADGLEQLFAEKADSYLLELASEPGLGRQLLYLLRKYKPHAQTVAVEQATERAFYLNDWTNYLKQMNRFPPEEGFAFAAGALYIRDKDAESRYWVLPEERLVAISESLFKQNDLGVRLKLRRDSVDTDSEVTRRLRSPLGFAELSLESSSLSETYQVGQASLYLWIGAIVLGLSVVSGAAVLVSLRRQASVTQLKDNLIATVTHELKTPVASVRLLVETLLDQKREGSVNTQEYLELIFRENQRLGRLIDNFLSFSRMERNKGNFAVQALDGRELVDEAVEAFKERFQGQPFELKVKVEEDVPDVAGDRDALVTVLGNLLENALKYGGASKRIDLGLKSSERGAVFEVRDYGKGISKRDQKRIFRKFYRAASDEMEHDGSVGLGLSIVDFIVSKHSGRIQLDSETGEGSTFRILIPYA